MDSGLQWEVESGPSAHFKAVRDREVKPGGPQIMFFSQICVERLRESQREPGEAIRRKQRFHLTLQRLTAHADRMWALCPRFGGEGGKWKG